MSSDARIPQRNLIHDVRRLEDVDVKHERIRQLLRSTGADSVLLQDPANIAWFSAGADVARYSADQVQTSLFITEDARLVATNAVDSAQIFEREAFGLGFQLKQREWYQPHAALVDDLSRGRRVLSDSGIDGTRGAARRIARLRLPLTLLECDRLRRLGQVLTHAVETTAAGVRAGVTEAAIAGELSHRLLRRTVMPARIQVCADGRNDRYRHWSFGEDTVESYVTISCVARRWGLHAGMSRTVSIDHIPRQVGIAHEMSSLIHATGIFFSRDGQPLSEIWPRVRRIYEKFGMASEWQLGDPADVIGYRISECQLTPDADFIPESPVPFFWHPTVQTAMCGDTVLVQKSGCEYLTHSTSWPVLHVTVKGHMVPCPSVKVVTHEATEPEAADAPCTPFSGLDDDDSDSARVDSIWEMETDAVLLASREAASQRRPHPR